jgi:hypothetical protein
MIDPKSVRYIYQALSGYSVTAGDVASGFIDFQPLASVATITTAAYINIVSYDVVAFRQTSPQFQLSIVNMNFGGLDASDISNPIIGIPQKNYVGASRDLFTPVRIKTANLQTINFRLFLTGSGIVATNLVFYQFSFGFYPEAVQGLTQPDQVEPKGKIRLKPDFINQNFER